MDYTDEDDLGPAWEDETVPAEGLQDHELYRVVDLGNSALALTQHPAFVDAAEGLAQSLYQQWCATDLLATEQREAIYRQKMALDMLRGALSERVRQGQLASDALRTLT